MKSYADIAAICRALDAMAEGSGEDVFPQLFKQFGIDEAGAVNAARQRALRSYLISHNRELPRANEPVAIHVPTEDKSELVGLTAAWLDGLVVGMNLMRPRWDRVTTEKEGGR